MQFETRAETTDAHRVVEPGARLNLSESESNRRSVDLSTFKFGPLPGTAQEADAIAPKLRQTYSDIQLLTERNAPENSLKTVQGPHILHICNIATHGFFLPIGPYRGGSGRSFGNSQERNLIPVSAP